MTNKGKNHFPNTLNIFRRTAIFMVESATKNTPVVLVLFLDRYFLKKTGFKKKGKFFRLKKPVFGSKSNPIQNPTPRPCSASKPKALAPTQAKKTELWVFYQPVYKIFFKIFCGFFLNGTWR